jgi:hypothetical protein
VAEVDEVHRGLTGSRQAEDTPSPVPFRCPRWMDSGLHASSSGVAGVSGKVKSHTKERPLDYGMTVNTSDRCRFPSFRNNEFGSNIAGMCAEARLMRSLTALCHM